MPWETVGSSADHYRAMQQVQDSYRQSPSGPTLTKQPQGPFSPVTYLHLEQVLSFGALTAAERTV